MPETEKDLAFNRFPEIRRPVLRYHGGKFRLAPKLIEIFPPHRVYTEAFGGGASVLLLKPRSYAEIYNDLDGEVVNVFRVLQNRKKAKRLEELLRVTPFAREEFLLSYKQARSDIERARRTIIRSFMGFGSDSISRMKARGKGLRGTMRTGFRYGLRSSVCAQIDWARYPACVEIFSERLQGVMIEQADAKSVIRKADGPETLHYVDPPYPYRTRHSGASEKRCEANYRHELSDEEHVHLAEFLHSVEGMVIVSSYPGKLYEAIYADWRQQAWTGSVYCSQNSGPKKRTEVVWLNEAAWKGSRQRLF